MDQLGFACGVMFQAFGIAVTVPSLAACVWEIIKILLHTMATRDSSNMINKHEVGHVSVAPKIDLFISKFVTHL